MQQKVFVWMLFLVLVPGVLLAQERKLKGKVVQVGELGEQIAEVGLTVTLDESGDTDNTNSHGLFGAFLPDRFKAGEKVTLQHR